LCKPFSLAVVSGAAPKINPEQNLLKPKNYDEIMTHLVTNILRTMAGYGHKRVTVGALGCGAFHNNPEEVSKIFRKVLLQHEFQGVFDEVSFAVMGNKNYTIFHKNLNGLRQ